MVDPSGGADEITPIAGLRQVEFRGCLRMPQKSAAAEAATPIIQAQRLLEQLHRIDESLQHAKGERNADEPPR